MGTQADVHGVEPMVHDQHGGAQLVGNNEQTSGSYTEVIRLPLRGSSRLRPKGLFIGSSSFLLVGGTGQKKPRPKRVGLLGGALTTGQ